MRFTEAKPDLIGVRIARDERRQIEELARERGVTISTLIREAVSEAVQRAAA